MNNEFDGKRITVIGMARSGLAAADVLAGRGALVTLIDSGSAETLAEALEWASDHAIPARADSDRLDEAADIVITSPGVRRDAAVLIDATARGIPVWGEIEAAYRVARAPILAITGTNGKTTTTALLGEMARAAGLETYVAGNIAAGQIAMPLIRAAEAASADAAIVAEISSFQLEWTPSFRPKVGAILNITPDHLDRQTWPEYVAAKWNLFANQAPTDFAVLGDDVPRAENGADPASQVVYFSQEPRPDWLSQIKLPGAHNLENVLAAVAMGRRFGLPEAAIRQAALDFDGVVHRLEYVATLRGARYINNSMCTNNSAFARSLDAIEGEKIVLAGGVYKGGDTSLLEQALRSPSVRELIVFGRSAETFAKARGQGLAPARVADTMEQAVEIAFSVARPGDTVILNPGCASFDQFKDFEDRGDRFKALIRRLL